MCLQLRGGHHHHWLERQHLPSMEVLKRGVGWKLGPAEEGHRRRDTCLSASVRNAACTAWRACAVVEVRWFPKRGLWLSGCGERLTMRLRIFEALCLLPGSWSARCFRMHSVLRRLLEAKGLRFRRAFLPVAMQTGHDQSTFYSACTLHQKRTTGVFRCGLEQGPRTVSRPNPSAPASMRRDASSSALSLTRSGPGPNDWCDCCASLGT